MNAVSSDPQFENDSRDAFSFIASASPLATLYACYHPDSFGNAIIALEGDRMRVKVVRDRRQFLVDLAPVASGDWFDISVVLDLIGAGATARELEAAEWRALGPIADAVREHAGAICARFQPAAWPATRASLRALQEARAKQLFDHG